MQKWRKRGQLAPPMSPPKWPKAKRNTLRNSLTHLNIPPSPQSKTIEVPAGLPLVPVMTGPQPDYRGAAATTTPTHTRVSERAGLHPHGRRNTARLVHPELQRPKIILLPRHSGGASRSRGGGHKRLSYRMRRGYKPALFAVSKYQGGDYI